MTIEFPETCRKEDPEHLECTVDRMLMEVRVKVIRMTMLGIPCASLVTYSNLSLQLRLTDVGVWSIKTTARLDRSIKVL